MFQRNFMIPLPARAPGIRGMNLLEGATTIQRNMQIGGHRVGSSALDDGASASKKPSNPNSEKGKNVK